MKLTVYGEVDLDTGHVKVATYESKNPYTEDQVRDILCELSRGTPMAVCVLCRTGVPATQLVVFGKDDDLCIAPTCEACATAHRPEQTTESLVAAKDGAIFEVRRGVR